MSTSQAPVVENQLLKTIALAGTVAGVVDVGVAACINHTSAFAILRVIASGLVGVHAFNPGATMVYLGGALQIVMSVVIAAIYAVAALQLSVLLRRPIACGLLYGVIIFVVMNMIVAPLSAVPVKPHVTLAWLGFNIAAMLLFGLIVATMTARFVKRK